jgi:transposase
MTGVLNGIFWVLRSGALRRALPENFGRTPPATSFRALASGSGAVEAKIIAKYRYPKRRRMEN